MVIPLLEEHTDLEKTWHTNLFCISDTFHYTYVDSKRPEEFYD